MENDIDNVKIKMQKSKLQFKMSKFYHFTLSFFTLIFTF